MKKNCFKFCDVILTEFLDFIIGKLLMFAIKQLWRTLQTLLNNLTIWKEKYSYETGKDYLNFCDLHFLFHNLHKMLDTLCQTQVLLFISPIFGSRRTY